MRQLLIIIFLSSQFSALAQMNIPFPDSMSLGTWGQHYQVDPDPAGTPGVDSYYQFFNSGDTATIEGIDYNILWWEGLELVHFRVDSQKVYIRSDYGVTNHPYNHCEPYWGPQEHLLYDFGLQVGDTFYLTPAVPIVLNNIDSILISGNYYRKLNFDVPQSWSDEWIGTDTYFWIEGIGSSVGFFPYCSFGVDHRTYFTCFTEWNLGLNEVNYWVDGTGCFDEVLELNEISKPDKTLIKIIDIMGRDTEVKPNTTLIYIYSDGTSEKVYRLE